MKFSDKLAKQRKNNNLSQEQLADKLNVSRQAVSKWESGQSYPDMEKIIQMTKILNCTLEDLLDDGTINSNSGVAKLTFNDYLKDLLAFITKTYNMFCSMTLKEKIKCLFEMATLGCILFIVLMIIAAITDNLIISYFTKIPVVGYDIRNILNTLIIIALLVLGIIIFIHLFKIRYLDYFITIEDINIDEKIIESPLDKKDSAEYKYQKRPKEKIIIRDPKHSIMNFYNFLMKIIIFSLKIFASFFIIPVIFTFVFLIILAVISIYHTIYASIFLYGALALIGGCLITYLLIEVIYNFLVNKKMHWRRTFIISIISLITIGISTGLIFTSLLNYNYVEDYQNLELETNIETITITENTIINPGNEEKITYVIDNKVEINKARLEVSYPKIATYKIHHNQVDEYDFYSIHAYFSDPLKYYRMIRDDIKNKTLRN